MSPEFHDGHAYTINQAQSATLGPKTNISDYRSRRSAISSLSNVGKPTIHKVDLRSEDNRSLQRQIEDKLSKIQKILKIEMVQCLAKRFRCWIRIHKQKVHLTMN